MFKKPKAIRHCKAGNGIQKSGKPLISIAGYSTAQQKILKKQIIEIIKRHYPLEGNAVCSEIIKKELGIDFTYNNVRNQCESHCVHRLNFSQRCAYVGMLIWNTSWGERVIKVIGAYSADKILCEIDTNYGRTVSFIISLKSRISIGKETFKTPALMSVYGTNPISKKTFTVSKVFKITKKHIVAGMHEPEFYCNPCNEVYRKSDPQHGFTTKTLSTYKKQQRRLCSCRKCFNLQLVKDRKNNVQIHMRTRLHQYVYNAAKGTTQSNPGSKCNDYLGCTSQEFRQHIASQFEPDWNWNNWGEVWEIDHRVPYSAYDLTDDEQCKEVCHYTNVRPLSVIENRTRTGRRKQNES